MLPSPQFDPRGTPLRQHISQWGTPPVNPEDTRVFRSWLFYDSDFELNRTRGRVNWNVIAGVALMMAVSAAGWGGVALLVSRFWK